MRSHRARALIDPAQTSRAGGGVAGVGDSGGGGASGVAGGARGDGA